MNRRRLVAAVVVVLVVGLAVGGIVWASSRPSRVERFHAALHPVDVDLAQTDLRRGVAAGVSSGRLLVLTNRLLDVLGGDAEATRRAQIDRALGTLDGAGCRLCEEALEDAR